MSILHHIFLPEGYREKHLVTILHIWSSLKLKIPFKKPTKYDSPPLLVPNSWQLAYLSPGPLSRPRDA